MVENERASFGDHCVQEHHRVHEGGDELLLIVLLQVSSAPKTQATGETQKGYSREYSWTLR